MKQIIATIGLASTLLLSGCGGVDSGNNATPNNFFNKTATLQGTVFDGVTGARISADSLKVTMVQGTSYRAASVRKGAQDFPGDYSISGVPISLNNQTTYRMIVKADSYQDFETAIVFYADQNSLDNNNTLDNVYNFVGNVKLYPVGAYANDVTVLVTYNGEPVADATVQLTRSSLSTVYAGGSGASLFSNINSGYLGNLMATTDATGVATFAGTSLALGGSYGVEVLPVTHEGTVLARTSASSISVGSSFGGSFPYLEGNISRVVAMNDQVPGTSNGLYIMSASNSIDNTANSTGTLSIVLSRPVALTDETTVLANIFTPGVAVLDPLDPVTATVSPDGLTLSLTPNFSTVPDATDLGLTVTYSNVRVRLTATNGGAQVYDVFVNLVNTSGVQASPSVLMIPVN